MEEERASWVVGVSSQGRRKWIRCQAFFSLPFPGFFLTLSFLFSLVCCTSTVGCFSSLSRFFSSPSLLCLSNRRLFFLHASIIVTLLLFLLLLSHMITKNRAPIHHLPFSLSFSSSSKKEGDNSREGRAISLSFLSRVAALSLIHRAVKRRGEGGRLSA